MGDCENSQVATPLAAHDSAGKRRLALVLSALVVLVISATVVHECRGAMEASRRAECSTPLKQFGLVCKMYAGEDKDQLYPPLSSKPGLLMLAPESIVPKYMDPGFFLVCPTMQVEHKLRGYPQVVIDDQCFLYPGYVLTGEADVSGFCAVYKEHIAKGMPFDTDLQVPAGQGNGGGNIIHRLQEGAERFTMTGINGPGGSAYWQSMIPVLIERPENHMLVGGNVLFMDGHVEFIRYPGKWPMTEKTINALKELDAMGG
jgi:prepilin-type processing-associated H-X9-DG protein